MRPVISQGLVDLIKPARLAELIKLRNEKLRVAELEESKITILAKFRFNYLLDLQTQHLHFDKDDIVIL